MSMSRNSNPKLLLSAHPESGKQPHFVLPPFWSRTTWAVLACLFACLMIFNLDCYAPIGSADGVLYIVVIWIAVLGRHRPLMMGVATFCTGLMVVGALLSPEWGLSERSLVSRCIAIILVWFMTVMLLRMTKVEAERDAAFRHLKQANQELGRLARVDSLTDTANRRGFDDQLAVEWRRASRDQQPLALILIDIDRFKNLNDAHGHTAGDRCLADISLKLQQCLRRPGDLLARWGGDEFAILLPGTNLDGALERAETIRRAVAACALYPGAGKPPIHLTISLGVAAVQPEADYTPEQLLQRADAALYRAKREGRNQVSAARKTHFDLSDSRIVSRA